MRQKCLVFGFITGILLLSLIPFSAVADGKSGGYTVNDAAGGYEVYTAEGLFEVAERINAGDLSAGIILKNDISIAGRQWIPLGPATWQAYQGRIEGNGHTISGLTCIEENGEYTGLIRYGGDDVVVQNLNLYQIYISGWKHAAGLVGMATGNVTIQNCYVQGVVKASDVGAAGLVAQFLGPAITISNSILDVDASACAFISQCISYESRSTTYTLPEITVRNVVSFGSCTETDGKSNLHLGGFLGYFNDAVITVSDSVCLTELIGRVGSGGIHGTFRNGTMTLSNLITNGPVLGRIYPGARGTTMTVQDVSVIGNPQTTASLFGDANMTEATTTTLQVDGTYYAFDSNPKVPCKDKASAIATAKTVLTGDDLNKKLNVLLATAADGPTHYYSVEAVSPEYLAEEADCPTKNTYYKSCLCGEKGEETFVAGNRAMHLTDGTVHHDENGHWFVCSVCGDTDAEIYAHDDSTWTYGETERTRTCRVCGYTQTEALNQEPETTTPEPEPKSGCGSVTGVSLLPIVVLLGGFIVGRKKEQ